MPEKSKVKGHTETQSRGERSPPLRRVHSEENIPFHPDLAGFVPAVDADHLPYYRGLADRTFAVPSLDVAVDIIAAVSRLIYNSNNQEENMSQTQNGSNPSDVELKKNKEKKDIEVVESKKEKDERAENLSQEKTNQERKEPPPPGEEEWSSDSFEETSKGLNLTKVDSNNKGKDSSEPKEKKGKFEEKNKRFRLSRIEHLNPTSLKGHYDRTLRISQSEYRDTGINFEINLSLYNMPIHGRKQLFITILRYYTDRER